MSEMKTINIKGKEYVTVAERIRHLSEATEPYSIESTYEYYAERKMRVVKATLTYKGNKYTGLAQEVEVADTKKVNFASALENAETSAIGRACAFAGIGIVDGIASADEINKAQSRSATVVNEAVASTTEDEVDKPWFNDTNLERLKEAYRSGEYNTKKEGLDWAFANFKVARKYQDAIKEIYEGSPVTATTGTYEDNDDLPF